MINYYDPMYNFKSDQLNYERKFKANTTVDDISGEIFAWYNNYINN
jgi:hypothetical protein